MPGPSRSARTRDTLAWQACCPAAESLSRTLASTTALPEGEDLPGTAGPLPAACRGSPRLVGTICALSRPRGAAAAELDHHPLPGCTTSCRQRAPHRAEIWRAWLFDPSTSSSLALPGPCPASAGPGSLPAKQRMGQDQPGKVPLGAGACDQAAWGLASVQLQAMEGSPREALCQARGSARGA